MDQNHYHRLIQGLVTGGFFIIVIPLVTYFAVRSKKEKKEEKEESLALWEGFISNPDIPTEDDFANYVKHCAKEAKILKDDLLRYLVQNKFLLLSTYYKISKKHVDYTKDMSYIINKIHPTY